MEDVADLLAQSEQLAQPAAFPSFRVFHREIQQFEHSLKRLFEAIEISPFERPGGALEFASDVSEYTCKDQIR